jgi:hypothetical protein
MIRIISSPTSMAAKSIGIQLDKLKSSATTLAGYGTFRKS